MYVNTLPGSGLDTRKMPIALFISDLSASAPFPGNLAVSAPPAPPPNETQIYRISALWSLHREGEGQACSHRGPFTPELRRRLTASPTEVGMANRQMPVT